MSRVQDLYNASVRPMIPAERLQLAKLILDDLARSESPTDVSDEWGDDDLADITTFASQHAGQSSPDAGDSK